MRHKKKAFPIVAASLSSLLGLGILVTSIGETVSSESRFISRCLPLSNGVVPFRGVVDFHCPFLGLDVAREEGSTTDGIAYSVNRNGATERVVVPATSTARPDSRWEAALLVGSVWLILATLMFAFAGHAKENESAAAILATFIAGIMCTACGLRGWSATAEWAFVVALPFVAASAIHTSSELRRREGQMRWRNQIAAFVYAQAAAVSLTSAYGFSENAELFRVAHHIAAITSLASVGYLACACGRSFRASRLERDRWMSLAGLVGASTALATLGVALVAPSWALDSLPTGESILYLLGTLCLLPVLARAHRTAVFSDHLFGSWSIAQSCKFSIWVASSVLAHVVLHEVPSPYRMTSAVTLAWIACEAFSLLTWDRAHRGYRSRADSRAATTIETRNWQERELAREQVSRNLAEAVEKGTARSQARVEWKENGEWRSTHEEDRPSVQHVGRASHRRACPTAEEDTYVVGGQPNEIFAVLFVSTSSQRYRSDTDFIEKLCTQAASAYRSIEASERWSAARGLARQGAALRIVAHDLIRPLISIQERAKRDEVQGSDATGKTLRDVRKIASVAVERARRVQSTAETTTWTDLSLGRILEDVCEDARRRTTRDVRVVLNNGDVSNCTSAYELGIATSQLVYNACRYADVVRIHVRHGESSLEISVWDNGPGFSESVRRQALDTGFSPQEDDRGTGFGLSLANKVVQSVGARMEVPDGTSGGCVILYVPQEGWAA